MNNFAYIFFDPLYGKRGFAEGKKEHEATQVPAQYDGLRCGRVGKHGLDLSGDRRLRERQQLRQPNARIGIGAANLQPIEILIGNCAGVGVQLGDERDHARWQRLGGTPGQLSRLDCACAAPAPAQGAAIVVEGAGASGCVAAFPQCDCGRLSFGRCFDTSKVREARPGVGGG